MPYTKQDALYDLTTLTCLTTHLLLAPYTKVEESFHMHATHDISSGIPLSEYDHFKFPGVVPRSFMGALALSLFSWPLRANGLMRQIYSRWILGVFMSISLGYIRRGVQLQFGKRCAGWFVVLSVVQFHYMFWGTRMVGNVFASVGINFVVGGWLMKGIGIVEVVILVVVCVVFRCDVVLLAGCILLGEITSGRQKWMETFWAGSVASLCAILLTVVVDSYFWQRWVWPEWEVLWYNTVQDGSRAYGTSPFWAYFGVMVPKLAPIGLPLSLYAYITDPRTRRYITPFMCFVFLYSFLPHKEWRFVMYIVPVLNVLSAVSITRLERGKPTWKRIATWVLRVYPILQLCITAVMLYVSIWNYPGGEALDRVHGYVYPGAVVHYDTFTAMTGASLFGHQRADVVYDKTEGLTEFEGFDFVVTENERVSGEWKVMEIVRGFDGVQVVGVRSYLNQVLRWIKSALVGHITSVPVPVHIKIGPKIWILENQKRIRGNA